MLVNREGRFKAAIGEHGVAETGPNNLATFVCEFHLVQELADGAWLPVDEDLSITGYFYLEKRDGSLNTVTIDQLKEAFGWDGRDPFWLQDADFDGRLVQLKLAFEEYGGKTRIKVQYVNSEDWSGSGVPQADETSRRSIAERLGAKLRANAGGSPSPAPTPTTPRPTPPKAATTAAATVTTTTAAPEPASMEQAWEAFVQACPAEWDRPRIEKEWFAVLGELFPGRDVEQLTLADWGRMRSEGPGKVTPF